MSRFDTLAGTPSAGIVTGDFNCEPQSAEYARMLAPFADGTPALHDAWQSLPAHFFVNSRAIAR